jgi:glycosyltransferase involved in cell wall biosynthesis
MKNTRVSKGKYPIRVLEVVFLMARGGVESYLMNVLRHIDTQKFQVDFLIHIMDDPLHPYVQELKSLGCRIIRCPDPRKHLLTPWRYAKAFKKVLREYGPYDIVHSHAAPIDGAVLYLAREIGVPIRIVTCHNPPPLNQLHEHKAGLENLLRRLYHTLSRIWVTHFATMGLGVGTSTVEYMFGPKWSQDPRWQVLLCGIDLHPFQKVVDPISIKSELGIPKEAFVVGHVGRFYGQKNHHFLVEIAAEVIKREPSAYFLLIGDGPLRPEIEQKVSQLNLTNHFVFAGSRSDVPCLMLGAIDAFLLPSLYEGLPLVLVEAQATGLLCIFTSSITRETDIVDFLIRRLELSEGAAKWAEVIIQEKGKKSEESRKKAFYLVKNSPFNDEIAAYNLFNLYENQFESIYAIHN